MSHAVYPHLYVVYPYTANLCCRKPRFNNIFATETAKMI